MDKRFPQAHKEARWALFLTLFYLVGWVVTAYVPDNTAGLTGLPRWFEFFCLPLPLPLVFIVLGWLMTHLVFRDIPLGDDDAQ